jgi:phage tail protein X
MALQYRTREGDTLDQIVWKHYGRQDGRHVEQVLEANPGLVEHGPILPAGVLIQLPDLSAPEKVDGVRLWD